MSIRFMDLLVMVVYFTSNEIPLINPASSYPKLKLLIFHSWGYLSFLWPIALKLSKTIDCFYLLVACTASLISITILP